MLMYSKKDVQYIVEDFLAKHFNFNYVSLNKESQKELEEACNNYGIEVENIAENYR